MCGVPVPYSEFVLCISPIHVHTHTVVSNEHTHTHTHTEQWAAIFAAVPGEQLGVRCLAQGSHLSRGIEGERERWSFTPSTYNPCRYQDSNPRP